MSDLVISRRLGVSDTKLLRGRGCNSDVGPSGAVEEKAVDESTTTLVGVPGNCGGE